MELDVCSIEFIASTIYNILPEDGSVKALIGYSDKNYSLVDATDHCRYVLKVVFDEDESRQELTDIVDEILSSATNEFHSSDLTVPKLIRSTNDRFSSHLSLRFKLKSGDSETKLCNVKLFEFYDGQSFRDLTKNDSTHPIMELYVKLGYLTGKVFEFFRTKNYLCERLKSIRLESQFAWQLATSKRGVSMLAERLYPDETSERRSLLNKVLEGFDSIEGKLNSYPEYVLHGDINGSNVLVRFDPEDENQIHFCLLDFQDIQVGQRIIDISICILYSILEQERLEFKEALREIPRWILQGYQKCNSVNCQLNSDELTLIPYLMALRLCQSVLLGQVAFENDPENSYVMDTNQRGWILLNILTETFINSGKLINSWLG